MLNTKCLPKIILLFMVIINVSGCAAVAVGAAGTAAISATDRRSVGTQLDDKTIQAKIVLRLNQDDAFDDVTDISVDVFNRQVLLTGQAARAELIELAETYAEEVDLVSKIHNQIRLGSPIPTTSNAQDIWLATKIKTQLVADENIPAMNVSVIVEDSEVFIMGLLTRAEANAAVELIRNVKGVVKVVRVVELTG